MSVQQLLRAKSDVSETAPTEETEYATTENTEPPVEVQPVEVHPGVTKNSI